MESEDSAKAQKALEDAHEWLIRMEDPACTAEDRALFLAWLNADDLHAQMYERAMKIGAALTGLERTDIDADLRPRTGVQQPSPWRRRHERPIAHRSGWYALGGSIAAAFAIAALLPQAKQATPSIPIERPETARFESAAGEIRMLALADGTQVTLGARSTLVAELYSNRRVVRLETGVAFFNVASDAERPFLVEAGPVTVKALGTRFDVGQSAGRQQVAVEEGRVLVSLPFMFNGNASSIIASEELGAGQQIVATEADGLGAVEAISPQSIGAWRTGRLIYTGATIEAFVADLNRYSDVPIRIAEPVSSLAPLRVTGSFLSRDVRQLLRQLADIHPIEIDESDPSEIVIRHRTP